MKDRGQGSVYAFVEFEKDDDADKAQNDLNNSSFMGNTIRVEYSRGKKMPGSSESIRRGPPRRSDYRVEVTHLPYGCSWQVSI